MPGQSRSRKASKGLRCTAKLKDGSPCKTWQAEDGLCVYHFNAANPEPKAEAVDLALPPAAKEALALAPGAVRAKLASDLAEGYPALVGALREAMSGEIVKHVACRKCGSYSPVAAADHKTRLEASKAWVSMGLGKLEERAEKTVDLSDLDVEKMSTTERRELMGAIAARFPELATRSGLLAMLQKTPD